MTEFLKTVDPWFMILSVVLLGAGFLWAIRSIFNDLKESIQKLNDTISKLFENDQKFEQRLSTLEGEHKARSTCWPEYRESHQ